MYKYIGKRDKNIIQQAKLLISKQRKSHFLLPKPKKTVR